MSVTKVGVHIISGNRLMRELLARNLNKKSDLSAVSADKIDLEFAKSLDKNCRMVALFDSPWSVVQETAAIRELLRPPSAWKIAVLGMEENPKVFVELVRLGTSGFLLKDASPMDVVAAVRAVASGEVVCPASLCKILFQHVTGEEIPGPKVRKGSGARLTRRERQLVTLVAQGLTNKEIASHLHLAEQTVKNHVHNILHKTGAGDRLRVLEVCNPRALGLPPEDEDIDASSTV
jgi:DNA-binding NarL/FixJ family response regulator